MSETLLVLLISIAFGGLVFHFSGRYQKKTGAKISPWVWGVIAFGAVWAMWWLTDNFLDIGSK